MDRENGRLPDFLRRDPETSGQKRVAATWQDLSKIVAKLDGYTTAIGKRGVHTDDYIRWYVRSSCFRDMMVLHEELGKAIEMLHEAMLEVGVQRKLLTDSDLDRGVIGTTI